jgi:hypothetical protein
MPAGAWAAVGVVLAWLAHGYAPKQHVCPPVAAYTAEQEKALAVSVEGLKPDDPLVGAMADYVALRRAARTCSGAK